MIDRDEVNEMATQQGIHVANVERDYVLGWVLAGIYNSSALGSKLVLKGGNSFRKVYFENARYSSDLDFTSSESVAQEELELEFAKVCDFITDLSAVEFDKDRNHVRPKNFAQIDGEAFHIRLYFKDFYGNPDKIAISVRIDISHFERTILPPISRNLIHPYSDKADCTGKITCLRLEEALAEKLKCLLQRVHIVDLFDFVFSVFINRTVEIDRSLVAEAFLQKTIFRPAPTAAVDLLVNSPPMSLGSHWQKYVVCPVQSFFDFQAALSEFRNIVRDLFRGYGRSHAEVAFYPSNLRNPILEAGRTQKLLRIVYEGVNRVCEPYSLAFKTRQDGVAREYLYVWDRSGGRSGQPGIRSFLHQKIQDLAILDESFEPRHEIELCKAGEASGLGYFSSSFGVPRRTKKGVPGRPHQSTRRRGISTLSVWTGMYVVECGYCGKRFKRKKPGTRLNKHKDKYGNQCYGRIGFLVH